MTMTNHITHILAKPIYKARFDYNHKQCTSIYGEASNYRNIKAIIKQGQSTVVYKKTLAN